MTFSMKRFTSQWLCLLSWDLDSHSVQLASAQGYGVVYAYRFSARSHWCKLELRCSKHHYRAHLSTSSWKNAKHISVSQSRGYYNKLQFYYIKNFGSPFLSFTATCIDCLLSIYINARNALQHYDNHIENAWVARYLWHVKYLARTSQMGIVFSTFL